MADVVECYRNKLHERLIGHLANYTAFVGEVAWLSDPKILAAMHHKCLGLVTQDRPIRSGLRDRYAKIICPILPESVAGVSGKTDNLGEVRKYGTFHSWSGGFQKGKNPFFMHRKILVLGDMVAHSPFFMGGEGPVHWEFQPKAIWTGSCNLSTASRRHCEQATWIEDEALAENEAAEFWETYQVARSSQDGG